VENYIQSLLCSLGICDEDSIKPFYPKVRDRDDVAVMKCNKSGVIFLSRSDHINIAHYENQKDFVYWTAYSRKQAVLNGYEDNQRRAEQFRNIITNKKWLDIGTGSGGILDLLCHLSSEIAAVEPQEGARNELKKNGYNVYQSVEEIDTSGFEIVTLFHVFEHFIDPIETLKEIFEKMEIGGKIIIEVPQANDLLISFFDLDSFKEFTFWSEHLILHTRESLYTFLKTAGFKDITISGYQRYPLANHLYWLAKGKPGGHLIWNQLRDPNIDTAYSQILARLDRTDTLVAVACK
jgi:2-polyprenyl-3-methyl-5-hydroxy-6-metoxy-1,4-benzoquinol methylase